MRGISASGVVRAADVLRVSGRATAAECREASGDIDRFLAARTAAGRPALVLVEQVASVGDDAAFDRAIAPLERLVEPTLNQPRARGCHVLGAATKGGRQPPLCEARSCLRPWATDHSPNVRGAATPRLRGDHPRALEAAATCASTCTRACA